MEMCEEIMWIYDVKILDVSGVPHCFFLSNYMILYVAVGQNVRIHLSIYLFFLYLGQEQMMRNVISVSVERD